MNDRDETNGPGAGDESAALDALAELGLTSYEVQVFVALQKLGTGSASDIDRIADVPRSQVYGAAEKLEERGLVEVQQSNPIRYRAVGLEEARERLRNRYEDRESEAFDYLEGVTANRHDPDGRQEDVWTLHGRDSITARTKQLIEEAEENLVYAGEPEVFDDELVGALVDRSVNGVDVTVVSAADEVIETFEGEQSVTMVRVPTELTAEDRQTGRVLIVDGDALLLSVLGDEELPELRTETAIWSTETGFAVVIIQLLESWLEEHFNRGTE